MEQNPCVKLHYWYKTELLWNGLLAAVTILNQASLIWENEDKYCQEKGNVNCTLAVCSVFKSDWDCWGLGTIEKQLRVAIKHSSKRYIFNNLKHLQKKIWKTENQIRCLFSSLPGHSLACLNEPIPGTSAVGWDLPQLLLSPALITGRFVLLLLGKTTMKCSLTDVSATAVGHVLLQWN